MQRLWTWFAKVRDAIERHEACYSPEVDVIQVGGGVYVTADDGSHCVTVTHDPQSAKQVARRIYRAALLAERHRAEMTKPQAHTETV